MAHPMEIVSVGIYGYDLRYAHGEYVMSGGRTIRSLPSTVVSVETDSGETPTVEVAGTIASVQVSPSQGVVLDVSNLGEINQSAITAFYGRQPSGGQ